MTAIDLTGLRSGPSQVWGGVRLVPLIRDEPIADLRLHARLHDDPVNVVLTSRRTAYYSYIPHGFVATWSDDGTPAASYGTRLNEGDTPPGSAMPLVHRRMVRREARDRVRFLPLHLALEGYLARHFGGPVILWREWSDRAIRAGLSPRAEEAYTGEGVRGLADALRLFEIHPGQCGVLLYVADALASAFAVPHPDDYRALHATLLLDLYGEMIHHYANFAAEVPAFRARVPDAGITSLAELRAAVDAQETAWAHFHERTMAAGLLGVDYRDEKVYTLGPFTLSRLMPPFRPKRENHIGEAITDADGRVAYLKTFRLSESQIRRGFLLDHIASHDWNLVAAAAALGIDEAVLGVRLEAAGFGALLRRDVLDGYRKRAGVRRRSAG